MEILYINGHWKQGVQLERLANESIKAGYEEALFLNISLRVTSLYLRLVLLQDFDPETDEIPRGAQMFLEACRRADGILFASPIMGGGASPKIREALGYLYKLESPNYELTGKPFGIIVHGKEDGGRSTVIEIMGQLSIDLGMIPVPFPFYRIEDGAEHSEDKWMKSGQRLVVPNIIRLASMISGSSIDTNDWSERCKK